MAQPQPYILKTILILINIVVIISGYMHYGFDVWEITKLVLLADGILLSIFAIPLIILYVVMLREW